MVETIQVLRGRLAQTASCQKTVRAMDLFPGVKLWERGCQTVRAGVMKQAGFFTGVAQDRNGRWQFRDVHWFTRAGNRGRR